MLKRILLLTAAPIAIALGQTQAELNSQTRAEFERADTELHRVYERLMARLPDVEIKRKLEQSQRAWVIFRDAQSAFEADDFRGGSGNPVVRYLSLTESTEQRIKQLKRAWPE